MATRATSPGLVLSLLRLGERNAAASTDIMEVEGPSRTANDVEKKNTIMQKLWDSALPLGSQDKDFHSHRIDNYCSRRCKEIK
ncbi:unnamed protein product [Urochloa humidicola]